MDFSIQAESALAIVFGMALLQSVGIPIPAATVLVPVGILAGQGQVRLWQVCIAYFSGQTLGDAVAYGLTLRYSTFINRVFPRLYAKVDHPIVRKLLSRGPALMILAACTLSWFRPIINYLAPALKIPFGQFLGWSLLRNIIFNSCYTLVLTGGVQVFIQVPALRPYLIATGIAAVGLVFVRRMVARRREQLARAEVPEQDAEATRP